jgi:hypothetical protein
MVKIALALACFLAFAPALQAQDTLATVPYERATVRSGERCIVCGALLDTNSGFVLLVKGRRVPLDPDHLGDFIKAEAKYFARLQPSGALFAESYDAKKGTALGGVGWEWFLAGLYVLIALLFAGLSGYVAVGKGLKPIPNFFVGLAFSAIGFLYVLTRPSVVRAGAIPPGLVKVPTTSDSLPCEKCGTRNHPSARRCAGCGTSLKPLVESEVARAR